jgi:serine/threonine protein kinase
MAVSYPRQFGKYVLLKPLAKGGMGEIYLAALGQIDGFDKLCVIKKVIPEKSDEGKAKRFLDEAKVVLRLAHSGLVNTFDAGQVEREFYIAMEMVEGKDLREVWNRCVRVRHRIPIEVALHVAREVARALSYVHTYGDLNLVHRDVAPPNIMLAYNGDVKLTDFGLARSALKQEHTQPGVVFGRAAYLAPEQARGEVADPGTDVYSLAVVLWELLTGHQYLQISGLDPAAALAMVRHPKPTPPSTRAPWVTPALDQVLMRALATERDKRFTSAEEFRLALSDAIAEAAPRTDAGRVSELMHAIYEKAIAEEAAERERFLKEVLPSFRAASTPAPVRTPPPVPLSRRGDGRVDDGGSRRSSTRMPKMAAPSTPGVQASQNDREARTRAKREAAQKVLAELASAVSENNASRK